MGCWKVEVGEAEFHRDEKDQRGDVDQRNRCSLRNPLWKPNIVQVVRKTPSALTC